MHIRDLPTYRSAAIVIAWVLGFAAPAAAEGLRIEPGQWEIRSETRNSMMPTPQVRTRSECVSAEDAEWSPDRLMSEAQDCSVSDVVASSDTLEWKVRCGGPHGGEMKGHARYRSSGERFDGEMKFSMNAGGMQIEMDVTSEGRRTGPCTP